MLRKAKSPVKFKFTRAGGSIIVSQVDIWRPTEKGWVLVDQVKFSDATQQEEAQEVELTPERYNCVFQCFVQESLNGRYDFVFAVQGKDTFADDGDVNTTPSNDDSKVYKDEFVLAVEEKTR
jgi:hypothetical protein